MLTRLVRTSGKSLASIANSSTTSSSRGSGSARAGRDVVAVVVGAGGLRAAARGGAARPRGRAGRGRRAAASRSVTIPTVCGSREQTSKAAPPLKSISTKVSRRRVVAWRRGRRQGAQQLALARAGRAADQRRAARRASRSRLKTPCSVTPTGAARAAGSPAPTASAGGPSRRRPRSRSSSGSSRTPSGRPPPTTRQLGVVEAGEVAGAVARPRGDASQAGEDAPAPRGAPAGGGRRRRRPR